MSKKRPLHIPDEILAAVRASAAATREQLEAIPADELLTKEERDDAAPFYFVLREFIQQLKDARVSAGLTHAEVAARSGMAVESLSRLETGAQTNPTWKTLGLFALAVGRSPLLTALPTRLSVQSDSGVMVLPIRTATKPANSTTVTVGISMAPGRHSYRDASRAKTACFGVLV